MLLSERPTQHAAGLLPSFLPVLITFYWIGFGLVDGYFSPENIAVFMQSSL